MTRYEIIKKELEHFNLDPSGISRDKWKRLLSASLFKSTYNCFAITPQCMQSYKLMHMKRDKVLRTCYVSQQSNWL